MFIPTAHAAKFIHRRTLWVLTLLLASSCIVAFSLMSCRSTGAPLVNSTKPTRLQTYVDPSKTWQISYPDEWLTDLVGYSGYYIRVDFKPVGRDTPHIFVL